MWLSLQKERGKWTSRSWGCSLSWNWSSYSNSRNQSRATVGNVLNIAPKTPVVEIKGQSNETTECWCDPLIPRRLLSNNTTCALAYSCKLASSMPEEQRVSNEGGAEILGCHFEGFSFTQLGPFGQRLWSVISPGVMPRDPTLAGFSSLMTCAHFSGGHFLELLRFCLLRRSWNADFYFRSSKEQWYCQWRHKDCRLG